MTGLIGRLTRAYEAGHAAPAPRLWPDPRTEQIASFKPAAVLIAVTDRPDPGLLLIHRPGTMRAHPGQVAFPGGRLDPGETPVEAALREAHEELGIPPDAVQVIGESDLYQTGSGYAVTPVLAVVPPDLPLVPNPHEVAQWFEAPLSFVLDPAQHQTGAMEWAGEMRRYVEMHWNGHRIWGVTGAIIANLAQRLNWTSAHD
ncbi:CoA pyrophosphatase [Novosphingobium sp. FSY-8]|uniref:CoA pyrophosphatase n=1 Tax=Novosphingobium ovatum TaxID=1908523 RepID=A0ABW9XAY3_9SPHN|nr:CoA pyrophosphatase [Novosphingobium ovatum]NBC35706.1 CoA pyrophosphatase [Novosphingobium ovatum]